MFAAWVADQELESIKRRTREGLERARQQGKTLGPPRKFNQEQLEAIRRMREAGASLRRIAETSSVLPTPSGGHCSGKEWQRHEKQQTPYPPTSQRPLPLRDPCRRVREADREQEGRNCRSYIHSVVLQGQGRQHKAEGLQRRLEPSAYASTMQQRAQRSDIWVSVVHLFLSLASDRKNPEGSYFDAAPQDREE